MIVEVPDIPDVHTQKIETVLLNAKADEVIKIFYDHVKPYSNTVNCADRTIDGELIPLAHYIRPIQPPKDNRLEVTDYIYPDWKMKPGETRKHTIVNALILQTRQPTSDTVLVNIEFSPFFESIVKDLLSKFEYDHAAPAETPKASQKPYIPSKLAVRNDWKGYWRRVKGPWKGGGKSYHELAEIAKVSESTIKKVIIAGEAGLLD